MGQVRRGVIEEKMRTGDSTEMPMLVSVCERFGRFDVGTACKGASSLSCA